MNQALSRELCRSELLPMICCFNFLPLTYTHPSWLDDVCSIPVPDMPGIRGTQLISQLILNKLDLADAPFWNFSERRFRYALLPGLVLNEFIKYIGAALCWKEVSQIIERDQIVSTRDAVGPDTWQFITQKAPLLVPEHMCVHEQSLTEAGFMTTGAATLSTLLADGTEGLHKRMSLKLPKGVWPQKRTASTTVDSVVTESVIKKILLFEVEPSWGNFIN